MEIQRIEGAAFGAQVHGLRLATLSDEAWPTLHRAWLDYGLLIFPGQHLGREEQVAFARRFGPIEKLGPVDIVPISNVTASGKVRAYAPGEWDDVMKVLVGNMAWHADSTYMPVMARGAVFSAEIAPTVGGETSFADMCAAYDALDPDVRARVEGLSARHSLRYSQSRLGHVHAAGSAYSGYGMTEEASPLRPLVKVHPETGRKSLLIGRHAHAIPGLSADESERLLEELLQWACQPPRVVTHRWTPGDVVVWDNRRLLHRALPWDMSLPRVMWHVRLRGDEVAEYAAAGLGPRAASGQRAPPVFS
jgi:alpha-ketoglutarate-dependent taurine dioxygenase